MSTNERSVSQSRIEQLALLRALVAFLGEKDQFGWWDCSFLGSTGRKYLAITHPRSHVATGVMAACEAARRVHDARIGKGRVYHLFRLPHATEQKLQRHALTEDNTALVAAFESKDKALRTLETLAKDPNGTLDGPVKLGGAKTLASSSIVGKEITVEDPFIRVPHQISNFLRFCELAVKTGSAQVINLVTGFDDSKQKTEAEEKLKLVASSLVDHGIKLNLKFSDTLHDREIRLDNGWTIQIGRGLDIYQKLDNWFSVGTPDLEMRPCMETKVDAFRRS
jgi:hypothetical protein